MKEKGNVSSSSSLVIISRRMLIAGIAGTALFSFGLGYFFGYGGTTTSRMVKRVEADNRIAPSEERTVLDSSGKPTLAPPATPDAIPKEPPLITRHSDEVAAAPRIQQEPAKTIEEKKPEGGIGTPGGKSIDMPGKKDGSSGKKTDSDVSAAKGKDTGSVKSAKKDSGIKKRKQQSGPAAKKAVQKKAASKRSAHFYAVQLGAFSDPAKARRLRDQLSAKGYKSSITTFSPASGETLSRVRIGHYTTKREAEELASGLKNRGIGGIVVYGSR